MNNKAFSLIELSIVLVIIGLLVAGITGGATLIENARIRFFINEINNLTVQIGNFKFLKNRLPGDPNERLYIGREVRENWVFNGENRSRLKDFGIRGFYDGSSNNTITSPCFGFWLDLYLTKINTFKPIASGNGIYGCEANKATPSFMNNEFYLVAIYTFRLDNNNGKWPPFRNKMSGIFFNISQKTNFRVKPQLYYKFDKKIDDGIYGNGTVRSFCFKENHNPPDIIDYETAINKRYKCNDIYIKVSDDIL